MCAKCEELEKESDARKDTGAVISGGRLLAHIDAAGYTHVDVEDVEGQAECLDLLLATIQQAKGQVSLAMERVARCQMLAGAVLAKYRAAASEPPPNPVKSSGSLLN